MGVATVIKSGLLYEDEFGLDTLDSMWEVIPNTGSTYLIDNGSIKIIPRVDEPVYLFIPELTGIDKFVFDVRNNFTPSTPSDIGGIIVFAADGDHIKLEQYYDEGSGDAITYAWMRLIRDYNNYSAYWSTDGSKWNLIGSRDFGTMAPKVGLFIEAGATLNLEVEYVRVTSSTKATVGNIIANTLVRLEDLSENVKGVRTCRVGRDSVSFDLNGLASPFSGLFVFTFPNAHVETSEDLLIRGGDEFRFEYSVELYYVDEAEWIEVSPNMERFLGYLGFSPSSPQRNVRMKIKNNLSGAFSNVAMTIAQTTQSAYLYYDNAGTIGEEVGEVLEVSSLDPNEEYVFWVVLVRDPDIVQSEVNFAVNIDSSYTHTD